MKKLHKAAITLPAEPRPIMFSCSSCVLIWFNAEFVPSGLVELRGAYAVPEYKALEHFSLHGLKGSTGQNLPVDLLESQNVANSTNLNNRVQMPKLHAV
jgi:hypothetical protein